ncbi:MAG: hypothetical protein AAGI07_14835 [Bacteroidota bacterium]
MGTLRILLAVSVLIGHAGGIASPDGMMTIQCFYIISGFYRALILTEK